VVKKKQSAKTKAQPKKGSRKDGGKSSRGGARDRVVRARKTAAPKKRARQSRKRSDERGSRATSGSNGQKIRDAIDVAESTFAPALDDGIMGDDEHVAQGTGEPLQEAAGDVVQGDGSGQALPVVETPQKAAESVDDATQELRSMFADRRADPVDDD
jgi:hypothetical protein